MDAKRSLAWIIAGLIVWFAIRMFSPRLSGIILAAFVIGALVMLGPQLARIPKS